MLHNVSPLYYRYNCRIAYNFRQLKGHDPGILQTIKIKVLNLKLVCLIYLVNRKRWAGDFVGAIGAQGQTAHKGSFATAKVANQLNNLTAL